jgi:hypothetical protein
MKVRLIREDELAGTAGEDDTGRRPDTPYVELNLI